MSRLRSNSEGAVPSQLTPDFQSQSQPTSAAIHYQPQGQVPISGGPVSQLGTVQQPAAATDSRSEQSHDDRLLIFNYKPAHESWRRKSILTCDGGGIRGFASSLIIQELMVEIGKIEQSLAYPEIHHEIHTSSYEPCEKPLKLKERGTGMDGAYVNQYLPCHYFDLMVGTSTGGLIATMLSRWRMTVAECLHQYEDVGKRIFQNPRPISVLGWPQSKHSKTPLKLAIQGLATSRTPGGIESPDSIFNMFPAPPDLCRTAVVAIQKGKTIKTNEVISRTQDGPYLFRSYRPDELITIAKSDTPLNWRAPNNHEIWKVCRATTAAPFYFEPQQIGDEEYCDGGAGVNNPTLEALNEMRRLHKKCVKTVVSLGTGKPPPSSIFGSQVRRGLQRLNIAPAVAHGTGAFKSIRAALTDCENTHRRVLDCVEDARDTEGEFKYYRFNIEEGLGKVKLNEMKSKRDDGAGGKCTTLEYIRKRTLAELAKQTIQDELTELAKRLVLQRRERLRDDPDQWERFACCTFYKCSEAECRDKPAKEHTFALKREMREHFLNVHGCTSDMVEAKVMGCRREPEFHTGPY